MNQTASIHDFPATIRTAQTRVLLSAPAYVPAPISNTVYALRGGRVGTCPLSRYRLPQERFSDTIVAAGEGNSDAVEMLPMLAAIADRIAPWIQVHIAPEVLLKQATIEDFGRARGHCVVEGVRYSRVGGLACWQDNLILMSINRPVAMTCTLAHELLHMMWRNHLSPAARDVLTASVSGGAPWPGEYYGDVEERVCRAFEAWVWRLLEGGEVDYVQGAMTMDSIFGAVWSGDVADDQIRSGAVSVEHNTLVRRNLLPPAPGIVERMKNAAAGWVQSRLQAVATC